MGVSKKKLKNKKKSDRRVTPEAKTRAHKRQVIQAREQVKASKRRAAAASRKVGDSVHDDGILKEVNSVDEFFKSDAFGGGERIEEQGDACDGNSDSDDNDHDDDESGGEGAFHAVGNDGFFDDLDVDSVDEEDAYEKDTSGTKHEQELATIREADPQFYKFLVENDSSLLNFRAQGAEDLGEEDGHQGVGPTSTPSDQSNERMLTLERFRRIQESAPNSFTAFKFALNSFHMAVRSIEGQAPPSSQDDEDQISDAIAPDHTSKCAQDGKRGSRSAKGRMRRGLLRIDSEATFSEVLEWCVANFVGLLAHYAGQPDGRSNADNVDVRRPRNLGEVTAMVDPTTCARWSRVKVIAQIFWEETLYLLNHLVAPQMLEFVLRTCSSSSALVWLWPFKSLRQRYFKRCCELWSSSSSHSVRLLSFLWIRNAAGMVLHSSDVARTSDVPPLESLIRSVLKSFAEVASRGYSWRSLSTFRFMENCIIELLRLDDATAYRVGYIWIRQLALMLRNACIAGSQASGNQKEARNAKKKKAAQQQALALIGWPFIRSIYFWTKAVGTLTVLQPLAYPLSTIVSGAMKNRLTSLQHFPFVHHCLRCLNRLASTLGVFVPISAHILKVFDFLLLAMDKTHRQLQNSGKLNKGDASLNSTKAPDFEVLLKLTDGQVSEGPCLEAIGSSLCFLATDHLGLLSRSPAFPEVAALVLLHLRKHKKHCRSDSLRRQIQTLLIHAEASAGDICARRDALVNDTFALKSFLVFDADTALAKARAEMLQRRSNEEQMRAEAEIRGDTKEKGELIASGLQEKKDRKKRKRQEQKARHAQRDKAPAENASRKIVTIARGAPRDRDLVEEMEFSDGDE